MVVVALLALLSALVFGGIRFGSLSWAHADRQRTDTQDMTAVEALLRDAIGRAWPAFATSEPTDSALAFDGAGDRLDLVTPLPAAIEAGVLAHESFFLAPGPGGRLALFMTWRLDLPGPGENTSPPEHRTLVLDRVRSIAFGYFGVMVEGQPAQWAGRWTGRDRLPSLVRIKIERDGGPPDAWPEIVAEPKALINPDCQFDQDRLQCSRRP